MKKLIILTLSLIGTLALTGCEQSISVNGGCVGSNSVSPKCDVEARYRATWKSGSSTSFSFDANLASVDFSQSNVNITNNSGNIVLAIENSSGSTIASSVFQWYRSGHNIYPTNPDSMNDFINLHMLQSYTLTFDIQDVETTGYQGSNNFVVLFNYGSEQIGASDSFYLNFADMNDF